MERCSICEVVEQAVQTEKLGCEFYSTIAKRFTENEGLKTLFEMLAMKEQEHVKTFSELKGKIEVEKIQGGEEIRAIVESEYFLGRNKSLPSLEHVKTVADAVKFAIGFEKETLLYFYILRDVIMEKEIVDEIINEEKSHIEWLSKFQESFVG